MKNKQKIYRPTQKSGTAISNEMVEELPVFKLLRELEEAAEKKKLEEDSLLKSNTQEEK